MPKETSQHSLIEIDDSLASWSREWQSMPEFIQEDLAPYKSIAVHFACKTDADAFSALVGQPIYEKTRSIWHPKADIGKMVDKRFVGSLMPKYPIYIPSKGRFEPSRRLTSQALHAMGVPHYMIVEEQELESYRANVDSTVTLLVLDKKYQREYDTCDDLGDSKTKGSGPARNFAWDHAASLGVSRHWTVDDNIDGFYRLYRNIKTPCATAAIFRSMEDFSDRYENVTMSGPNYFMFASRKTKMPPFVLNTRIYSCNLIKTDSPYRWRGRYNEDTDLSLRMLKDRNCTVLFNAFLQMKMTTQSMGGGNTDQLYADGTLAKSEMIARLHPDVCQVVERWNRIHHFVDYSIFRKTSRLARKPDVAIQNGVNDFGMTLQDLRNGEWITREIAPIESPVPETVEEIEPVVDAGDEAVAIAETEPFALTLELPPSPPMPPKKPVQFEMFGD